MDKPSKLTGMYTATIGCDEVMKMALDDILKQLRLLPLLHSPNPWRASVRMYWWRHLALLRLVGTGCGYKIGRKMRDCG